MTVVRRIAVGYAGLILLMLVIAGVGVGALVYLESGLQGYTDNTTAQLTAAHEIIEGESRMGAYGLSAIGVASKRDALKAKVDEIYASTNEVLDTAESLHVGDEAETAAIQSMRGTLAEYNQVLGEAIALAATDEAQAWAKVSEKVIPTAQQINAMATTYLENEQAIEVSEHSRLQGTSTTMLVVILAVALVALVSGVIAVVFTGRTIARQLRDAFTSISSSASELLAVSSQVAAGAAQTSASTNETTATVEEVKQTAQLAHEKASHVAENSENLAQVAEAGRATVEDILSGIEQMQNQMGVVAETIDRLSDQTQAVGEIIATVSDLAEQSNLLSVNASIEAAKAGDQGKGFTVVAQEVKNLAEQSKQAVTQVRTILSEIQKAGNQAVQAAQQSRETIEAGRQQSLQSGETINALAESVSEAAQSAVQIAACSRQQLAGMEQIGQAIESINQAGAQSVAGTRQVEQEVKNLQDLALRLKHLVDAKAKA